MAIRIPVRTPAYVMLSSDYSQQEPKLTAFVSKDEKMIQAFKDNKDIYATIASLAFNLPYEKCLEFHPETGEYQPDGKARRGEAKTIVLGITYGRSVVTIADQLFGTNDNMTPEEKISSAQKIYDSVLNAFPNLRTLMTSAQKAARVQGYVETILGRRRHLPDMQLPEFEFKAMQGYINPDVDPLDPSTLNNKDEIPERVVAALKKEFAGYKYFGQIAKRTRELYEEEHIKVINNRPKITDATRQCVNCVDAETEILTEDGWKRYDQIHVGEEILAYDVNEQSVVHDSIEDIIVSHEPVEMVQFKSPTFDALTTMNHRWVSSTSKTDPRIVETSNIYKNRWPDYPILRVGDNCFEDNLMWSDNELKLLGWVMTDGCYSKQGSETTGNIHYGIHIYQSTKRKKNAKVYASMISTLSELQIPFNDRCSDGVYHEIYLNKVQTTEKIWKTFPDRVLTYDFIFSLSERQAEIVMTSMIEGDGTLGDNAGNITYTCNSALKKDLFQALCFVAGKASNAYEITPEDIARWKNPNADYSDSLPSKQTNVQTKNPYWTVNILRVKRAQIYPRHKSMTKSDMCWCVQTATHTWIARRNGKVYITGNSIIQGSAADQTKLALLRLKENQEWNDIGGRLLVPVHDELIAEVPIDQWERGGEILSEMMVQAADFLPFSSKCDVTTTLRWYGLEYPCPYKKPTSLDTVEPEEVKWLQYCLCELEYKLPVFKDENGDKPRGDAALGVNGIISDAYDSAIAHYKKRYNLKTDEEFIDHIETKVFQGR